jgi:hypothetical protein
LSTIIPSIQSLKEVGAQNHLLLRGDKSLASRLRHRLKTLSDGVEDRSSRGDKSLASRLRHRLKILDVGLGVGALLGLTLLLALA